MMKNNRSLPLGVTVLELLIILTALAVIILISVPGSSYLLETYRLKHATSQLVDSLNRAQSEAVSRASVVRVCPSTGGRFCRRDGDWSHGWLVFSDGNGDGVVHDIELLQSFDAPHESVRIMAEGAVTNSASFNASGLEEDNGSQNGEFRICNLNSNLKAKSILISEDGWVQMTQSAAKGCNSN
jgi:Tfp pilus assembly protein FimT